MQALYNLYMMRRKNQSSYTVVNYLESTGTQYIDTGVTIPNINNVVLTCDHQANMRPDMFYFFGCSAFSSGTTRRFIVMCGFTSYQARIRRNTTTGNIGGYPTTAARRVLRFDGRQVYVDDVAGTLFPDMPFPIDKPILLFATHADGSNNVLYGANRIYSFSIAATSTTPARDFVPRLDSNGTPCMLDLVSNTPFYNLGTGQFLFG